MAHHCSDCSVFRVTYSFLWFMSISQNKAKGLQCVNVLVLLVKVKAIQ